jgi:hypothetical protein
MQMAGLEGQPGKIRMSTNCRLRLLRLGKSLHRFNELGGGVDGRFGSLTNVANDEDALSLDNDGHAGLLLLRRSAGS